MSLMRSRIKASSTIYTFQKPWIFGFRWRGKILQWHTFFFCLLQFFHILHRFLQILVFLLPFWLLFCFIFFRNDFVEFLNLNFSSYTLANGLMLINPVFRKSPLTFLASYQICLSWVAYFLVLDNLVSLIVSRPI